MSQVLNPERYPHSKKLTFTLFQKRRNCPVYTHTHTHTWFLSPGVLEHVRVCLKAFLDHGECGLGVLCWWKSFAVRCGLWESWVLLHCPFDQQRDVLSFHTDPANPLRLALLRGWTPPVNPILIDGPRNNLMSCEHCKRFLFPSLHLAPALPHFLRGDLDSMNRVDHVKELWEYPTVAEKRCGRGRCESWPTHDIGACAWDADEKKSGLFLDICWNVSSSHSKMKIWTVFLSCHL